MGIAGLASGVDCGYEHGHHRLMPVSTTHGLRSDRPKSAGLPTGNAVMSDFAGQIQYHIEHWLGFVVIPSGSGSGNVTGAGSQQHFR